SRKPERLLSAARMARRCGLRFDGILAKGLNPNLLCSRTTRSGAVCAIELTVAKLSERRVRHGHGAENAGETTVSSTSHVSHGVIDEKSYCAFREGSVRRYGH